MFILINLRKSKGREKDREKEREREGDNDLQYLYTSPYLTLNVLTKRVKLENVSKGNLYTQVFQFYHCWWSYIVNVYKSL